MCDDDDDGGDLAEIRHENGDGFGDGDGDDDGENPAESDYGEK